MQIKTIDIQTKEWFDKVNGNSYFSAEVTTNYGMEGERRFILPFQYGYGNHSEDQAFSVLRKVFGEDFPEYRYQAREAGIIVRYNKQEGCRKRDLVNPTAKEIAKAKKAGVNVYPFFEVTNGWPF